MSRTLLETRQAFSWAFGELLHYASTQNYRFIIDEVKRSPEQAKWNATHCRVMVNGKRCEQLDISHNASHQFLPIGIRRSVHIIGLAGDILLIDGNKIEENPAKYKVLGDFWLKCDPMARWGGSWGWDYGHFSIEWQGRK